MNLLTTRCTSVTWRNRPNANAPPRTPCKLLSVYVFPIAALPPCTCANVSPLRKPLVPEGGNTSACTPPMAPAMVIVRGMVARRASSNGSSTRPTAASIVSLRPSVWLSCDRDRMRLTWPTPVRLRLRLRLRLRRLALAWWRRRWRRLAASARRCASATARRCDLSTSSSTPCV